MLLIAPPPGISVEGSIIAERHDANALAYHSDVSVKGLLGGAVPRPDWAQPLYQTLDACTKFRGGQREWIDDSPAQEPEYAFAGLSGNGGEQQPRMLQKKKKSGPPPFPPVSWGEQKPSGAYFREPGANISTSQGISAPGWDLANQDSKHATSTFETQFESDFNPQDDRFRQMHNRGFSLSAVPTPKHQDSFGSNRDLYASDDDWPGSGISRANTYGTPYSPYNRSPNIAARVPSMPIPELSPTTSTPFDSELNGRIFDEPSPMTTRPIITPKAELTAPLTPGEGVGRAIALFDFHAVEVGNDPLMLQPSTHTARTVARRCLFLEGTSDYNHSEDRNHRRMVRTSMSFDHHQLIGLFRRWTGKVNGRSGTFPANFVEVV